MVPDTMADCIDSLWEHITALLNTYCDKVPLVKTLVSVMVQCVGSVTV